MKKIIKIILAVVLLLVALLFLNRADAYNWYYCNNNNLCIVLDEKINTNQANYINNINGVVHVTLIDEPRQTIIEIDQNIINYTSDLEDYVKLLEINIRNNRAYSILDVDNKPVPLCLIDFTTHNINGVYSVNNQLVLIPNDVRCSA